jgi:hypothetical protein
MLKKAAAAAKKPSQPVAIVSYDETPGIQAIATTVAPRSACDVRARYDIAVMAHSACWPASTYSPAKSMPWSQASGRFEFTFTPKHGSWLNLIEGFFSKLARCVLRHIRGATKQELKEPIMAAIDDINQHSVV